MLAPMSTTQERAAGRTISVNEAAESLDCSPRTIRRYIASGLLPAYRMGPRLIRIDPAELDAMLHKVPTADQPSDYPKYNGLLGGPDGA
jgi:excisionase family DNA binding protein